MAKWLQYLINEVLCSEIIHLWQKIHNSEIIRIGKLSILISRPLSFAERVLRAPRPDSTSIFSGNSSIILRTHYQCGTPSSSSAVLFQALPAAKQQVVFLFVSDRRSICEGFISNYKISAEKFE
jgi:hypothetical protein